MAPGTKRDMDARAARRLEGRPRRRVHALSSHERAVDIDQYEPDHAASRGVPDPVLASSFMRAS